MKRSYSVVFFLIAALLYGENIYAQDSVTVIPNTHYRAGLVKKIFLGAHYRKEWSTPVNVKVFHIDTAQGGLTPLKQGGSRQTTNLRLKDSLGREYVLRSVNKTPTKALPEELRKTFVGYIFQDQASSENPYGPLVIPPLAKAAGVFYTNPRLVFIPADTSFGQFEPVFTNMLAYFEERPDEDMSHLASSGNSSNVIGTEKMYEKLYKDHDNSVDARLFARTRLFDMLIGDWGRHEEQWRWATYDSNGGKFFKPIPRDRDHVFYKADGLIPYLGTRKWALRNIRNFDYKYKDIIGLNLSATSLDRSLLSELSKEEWVSIAQSLRAALTDSVISAAVKKMPPNIYAIHGKEITSKLIARRDALPKVAARYYRELSRDVDIPGSARDEVYHIKRLSPSCTEVTVVKKENNDTLYHRIFNKRETQEIRLYGLGGDDVFEVDKDLRFPRIRVVKEEGSELGDSMRYGGVFNQYAYRAGSLGNELMSNTQIIFMRSGRHAETPKGYVRSDYHYNLTSLSPSFSFNVDDGLFLGLAVIRKTFAFRKYPYSAYQTAVVNYATNTGAVSFKYFGDFKKVFGSWNTSLDLRIFGPKYALNYFGLGNETVQKDTSIRYYRVRANQFLFNPLIYKNLTSRFLFGFGPQYQYVSIQRTPDRFIATSEAGVGQEAFDRHHYLGLKIFFQVLTLDNILFPKNGVRWNVQTAYYHSLTSTRQFLNTASDFSVFYTPKFLSFITLGTRVGGGHNLGDYEFYQSNTLGGTTNLRGYRRTRFYGRTSFYHNIEARVKVMDVNFYLFPGKLGFLLFYDYGRVWQDNEKSHLWHTGYGPGIWVQIYNRVAFTGTYGIGSDNAFVNVQFGFLF